MSLILEALRKSEAERRRGLAPDVAMELPPAPASRPRTLAAWLLPALVVAVLLVVAGWWARREPATAASPVPAIETTGVTPDANYPSPTEAPTEMPRIESKPAPAVVANLPTAETPVPVAPTPAPRPALPPPAPAVAAAARPVPIQPLPVQPPAPTRPLPPASDISDDTSMLPPIKLSMHMWDNEPSRRFVILNGQRMAEGDRYSGITVVSIERKGVVVESNGAKARVPLP